MHAPPDVHGRGDLVDAGDLGRIYVEVEGEGPATEEPQQYFDTVGTFLR